ncbi:MAG: ATP-binding protein [Mycobacterium sp.]
MGDEGQVESQSECQAEEMRTLFLFEQLSDAQIDRLCADGRVETHQPGPLFTEGEPAACFYVLIDGELVMSARAGGFDVQTRRTSQRGAYCGAWSAYVPEAEPTYTTSVRVTRPSRFYVLDAERFAAFMQTEFPMAVHLLAGHTLGTIRQQQLVGQRARLLGLGTITAGLTHHLNNPAAATGRAVAGLRESVGKLRRKLASIAEGNIPAESLHALIAIQDDVAEHVGASKPQQLSSLESSHREERIGDWLDDHGIADGWDYAPTFVDAGLDVDWLERVSNSVTGRGVASSVLQAGVAWLKHTVDTELRMREIAEASRRISALLASAKQYSQMDRGDYQCVDVHDLLRSTLMMFDTRIGGAGPVKVVTDFDLNLPEISCYAGDLNQVWTNVIENALEAMGDRGTLTMRTSWEREDVIRVEICDDGPGIPSDVIDNVFTPFFSTKPVGEGAGLGLDLAWRIVEKHEGHLSAQSVPGDTRFIVCLPVRAPAPGTAGPDIPIVAPTTR